MTHNKVMFGLYVEVFQMWTSLQQNEVLNIVQAKKYPEVPTFWRLFYRAKMAEISYLLSHFNAMCDNICVICAKPAEGYNLLDTFESALCRSNHFVFSKWLFLKGIWIFKVNRLQIILVAKNIYIYVSQLFISRMPKMRAISQLVSAPLNPIPI